MVAVILGIVLGIGFTIIAVENTAFIPVSFLGLTTTVPLYAVGALSFLLGVFVCLFFNLFDMISTSLDLSSKDSELRNAAKTNQSLATQVQKLNLENSQLRERLGLTNSKLNKKRIEVAGQKVNGFFDRLRNNLKPHGPRTITS